MAGRKRPPDASQTGFLGLLPEPPPRTPLTIAQLHAPPSNDDEPPCPSVRIKTVQQIDDTIEVVEEPNMTRPYVVSYRRFNGTHFGSMCLTLYQLKQLVYKASSLIGGVAVNLDEFDDQQPEWEVDSDE